MSTPTSPPIDVGTCVVCGRAYRGRSKPQWVRDARGVVIGTAHTSCTPPYREADCHRVVPATVPLEAARFEAWHDTYYHPRAAKYRFLAAILIGDEPPQDTPSARQRDLMAHWSRPGNSCGAAGADAAWARYVELVAEFRAWLAAGEGGAS